MKQLFRYFKLSFTACVLTFIFSCEKKKDPFPIFPKEEGGALTTPVNLPFYDSINYGSTVATFAIPPGWLEATVTGAKTDRGWAYRPNYGVTAAATDGAMIASGFSGNIGTDNTYLIVGPFNTSSYDSLQLTFDLRLEYDTDPGSLSFKYSTDYTGTGDPEAGGVTWTTLNDINTLLPTANTIVYVNISDNFVLKNDKVFIGIHFSGGTNTNSKRWRIDNFWLKGL